MEVYFCVLFMLDLNYYLMSPRVLKKIVVQYDNEMNKAREMGKSPFAATICFKYYTIFEV